jgi:hypothetical protein
VNPSITGSAVDVKGTAIAVIPEYVKRTYGQAAYCKWLGSLTEDSRKIFETTIKLSDWYPIKEAYLEPTAAVCQLFFESDLRGAWELGRFSADYALGGVYRMFVWLPSVKFFIGRASTLLSTYLKPCTSQVVSVEDGRAVVRITELPESHPLIEQRIAGWVQRALEIHGCKNVAVGIPKSLARGEEYTELAITWDKE